MLGAIAGDIIGARYENSPIKTKRFPLFSDYSFFTDDSVLTIATAGAILNNKNYGEMYMQYGKNYPERGYGRNFKLWLNSEHHEPYNSFGNGSAMRVSPIGYAFNSLEETLEQAKKSASVTHDHPEGIKGAQAVASAIYLARKGYSKEELSEYITNQFGYSLNASIETIRPYYHFDVTCQGSVPESIIAFLEATNIEDTIRNAVSLGGDSDTQACIAGSIGEAYFGEIPDNIVIPTKDRLSEEFLEIIQSFYQNVIP